MIDLLRAAEAVERAYVESLPDPERDARLYRLNLAHEREEVLLATARAVAAMDEHDKLEQREGKQAMTPEGGDALFKAVRQCRAFLTRYPEDDVVPGELARIHAWLAETPNDNRRN